MTTTGSTHNNLAYSGIKNGYQPTYRYNDHGKAGGGFWSPGKVEMNSKYTTAVNQVFDQVPNGGSCNDLLRRELSEIDH